jgi:uncharacterized Zn-binding protein involved in type VI secretion
MSATIIVNGRSVVHKDSGGQAPSVPDFCKTPAPPGPPVPIPYPNLAKSSDTADGSTTVKMDGNPIMLKGSTFSTSTGDEAGTLKGVASNTNKGVAKFADYSFDVKVEGKNVPRLGDPMTNNGNGSNAMTVKEIQTLQQLTSINITQAEVDALCAEFCKAKDNPNVKNGRKMYSQTVKSLLDPIKSKLNIVLEAFQRVPSGRCFPDVLFMLPGTPPTPWQVVDFKFPGDYARPGQVARWQEITQNTTGTQPILLDEDTCGCF